MLTTETINAAKDKSVFIYMGSISDWEVVAPAADMLDKFQIRYFADVVSAHRTPSDLEPYARLAEDSGGQVIIAAAGGAAHLPGMLASYSVLPVIGVPVKPSKFTGEDSIYSILQMPPGIPVGTMALNGAANAAIYAAEIIGAGDKMVRAQLRVYKNELEAKVSDMRQTLRTTLSQRVR
ncbi:MAG: 5-(carboxyamino)imidazole ribonucleotide mutase [Rickettsiales bacterium]|jgi:phosphoribosylaminoimidazole carboxylase PurE protein|nr:5-(carboxyamino)imidazole ribonucleotide mutase [Rickettsiales bacterium]